MGAVMEVTRTNCTQVTTVCQDQQGLPVSVVQHVNTCPPALQRLEEKIEQIREKVDENGEKVIEKLDEMDREVGEMRKNLQMVHKRLTQKTTMVFQAKLSQQR